MSLYQISYTVRDHASKLYLVTSDLARAANAALAIEGTVERADGHPLSTVERKTVRAVVCGYLSS